MGKVEPVVRGCKCRQGKQNRCVKTNPSNWRQGWEASMSMKTILVPMEDHDMRSAMETALLLGQRNNSYIEGFALRWQVIELLVGIDAMGGLPLERYKEDIEEEAKKAKRIFEIFMQEHGVPRSTKTTESV